MLEIKEFNTGCEGHKKILMETWVKILAIKQNIVCWAEKEKLTMWIEDTEDGIAAMEKL